jgi:hypothetical protein
MPEPTDLVTNLPADFEVFGQAVDSDFADLLGGTTGQVLSKTSNTDLDFTWTSANPGDITGVTAGTGISGGGTSGTVTVTNSMATAIDAKGDLIAGTGADAFSRLAVGTNDYVLTAASGEATGIKWAALPAATPTFNGARVFKNSYQSISNNTTTAITWDAEDFDSNSYHSNSVNNTRFTVPSTGYYQITGFFVWEYVDGGSTRYLYLKKNGSTQLQSLEMPRTLSGATAYVPTTCGFTTIVSATAADYFELLGRQDSGGALGNNGNGSDISYFAIQYLGA